MGNCFFFKYSPRSKSPLVSDPASIKIPERSSEASIINPQNMHIDLIIEGELPLNLLSNGRNKEGTEISIDSPHKTPKNVELHRTERKKNKILGKSDFELEIHEKFEKTHRKMEEQDVYLIIKSLKSHSLFFDLTETELEDVVSNMFYCEVQEGEFIFKQGDAATAYFIINEGSMEIIINEEVKKVIKAGEGFGELALLFNSERSASIRAVENCGLWGIDRKTFRKVVQDMMSKQYKENRKFMEKIKLFQTLTEQQKDSIATVFTQQKFKKGEFIVIQGDPASSFYVIKEGTVSILKDNAEIRKLAKGDSFGEQALYYKTMRSCSVRADCEVRCLALGRDVLTQILGDQIQVITFKNTMRWAFEKNRKLMKLTSSQIERIIENMQIMQLKKNEIIFSKGEKCNKFIIMLESDLKNNDGEIVVEKGKPFGQDFLSEKNDSKKCIDEDMMMSGDGILASISIDRFFVQIGGSWDNVVVKNERSYEKTVLNPQPMMIKEKTLEAKVKLEDLIFIKKLGSGQFGSVYLVKHRDKKQFFGLKTIAKYQILEQNLEKHLEVLGFRKQEKKVLEDINFPFIMRFFQSMKDELNIYFLVEYIKGMELFDVIRDIGLLKQYDAQFYTSLLILSIEYLHTRSIIYRDIKPENIMIDNAGYLRLIDMGTAKILSGKQGNRTFTIIGTPHYMAPEIISGKGYSFSVDLWSIGICLYEFICGGVPFAEEVDDPYEIYEQIIKKTIIYPSFMKDKKAKKLIDQLLSKVPELRLGGSYHSLKSHSWFHGFDWEKLFNRELRPPFIPPKKKMISDEDIKKLEIAGKLVIDEIRSEEKYVKNKKKEPRDPNWDSIY